VGRESRLRQTTLKAGSAARPAWRRSERARPLFDRALPLARELGDPLLLAIVSGNLGIAALFTGDLDQARNAFDEQLRLCRKHVFWVGAEGLTGLAAIAPAAATQTAPHVCKARRPRAACAPMPTSPPSSKSTSLRPHARVTTRGAGNEAQAAGAEMSVEQAIAFDARRGVTPRCISGIRRPGSTPSGTGCAACRAARLPRHDAFAKRSRAAGSRRNRQSPTVSATRRPLLPWTKRSRRRAGRASACHAAGSHGTR
jgi:hypothetical protein